MKRHLIAVGIAVIALAAWVGTASAANDPPPGADQILGQWAGGSQGAPAQSTAGQDASNLGLPIDITGIAIPTAPSSSSASQDASNKASADASNKSSTDQSATATQTGGSSSCSSGCGGAGQAQAIDQSAQTKQDADADANAKQNAVNANVPVSIAGGSVGRLELGGSKRHEQGGR